MKTTTLGLTLLGASLLACGSDPSGPGTPDPDLTPPVVALTAPANGGTVAGMVTLSASATDPSGVAGVTFRVDGVTVGVEDVAAPYEVAWNSVTASEGTHQVTALARDSAGNDTVSASRSVTVDNQPQGTLRVALVSGGGAGLSGTVRVTIDSGALGASRSVASFPVDSVVAAGAHTVTLSGLAAQCALAEPSTQAASVTANVVTTVTYTVTCGYTNVLAVPVFDLGTFTSQIRIITPGGALLRILPVDSGKMVASIAFRPDGRGLAYSSLVPGPVPPTLRYVDLMTGSDNLLTGEGTAPTNSVIAWSPDGSQLVFSDSSYALRILTISSGLAPKVTNGQGANAVDWSPDGTTLVFTATRDTGITIYRMDPSGGGLAAVNLPPPGKGDTDVQWSPDGTKLYFSSTRDPAVNAIWRMDANGSGAERVTAGSGFTSDTDPHLSPGQDKLGFRRNDALWIRDLASGNEAFLVGQANAVVSTFDWAR